MTIESKQVFTNATTNSTSLDYRHSTRGPKCLIQITGTMGSCTVTPWMTIHESLDKVALNGITYTTATVYELDVTRDCRIDLRITGATGSTNISAAIAPVEGY